MGRLSYWGILGIFALALCAGAYYFLYQGVTLPGIGLPGTAGPAPLARASAEKVEKSATVEATAVTVDDVVQTIRAVGTLQPNEAVIVSPEIPGRVARLPFGEGDLVKAGDPLVELDPTILQAEVDKAESTLALATANRQRALTLASQGTGTLRARDESIADYREAEANLTLAKARLAKATITAPFSGVVGIRSVSVGAYVNPGDRIVELADIDPIKVDFRVPELALSSLRPGQSIRVTVDALPGQSFKGEVYVIDPMVDANGRAVRLRARIPNPDRKLSPGLFARVDIVVGRRENALLVPESAIFAEGQTRYVYRVVDGRAVRTQVSLGQRRPGQVEIRDGLEANAMVVTAGHQQIRDGSLVTIVTAEAKT
jgi:membrane fusion protein (multidrug efflux system)